MESAAGRPPALNFVFLNATGEQVSNPDLATQRVPVVELDILTVDASYRPVAPPKAAHIEMTEYGPNHRFLRHTTALGNGAARSTGR